MGQYEKYLTKNFKGMSYAKGRPLETSTTYIPISKQALILSTTISSAKTSSRQLIMRIVIYLVSNVLTYPIHTFRYRQKSSVL